MWALLFLTLTALATVQACTPSPGVYCNGGVETGCPSGYYCPGGATGAPLADTLKPCPKNTYFADIMAESLQRCVPCLAGQVTNSDASISEDACHVCAAHYYYMNGDCVTCPQGTDSVAGSFQCSSCAPGTFSSAASCTTCRPGTYSDIWGAGSCTACEESTYTFTFTEATGVYAASWGAQSAQQCLDLPLPPRPTLCLPGNYLVGSLCVPCPLGYYCPEITISTAQQGRFKCPNGQRSASPGAILASDCTQTNAPASSNYTLCSVSKSAAANNYFNNLGASVTGMAASLDGQAIFFTTATAVHRLMIDTMVVAVVAGQEGTYGNSVGAVAINSRFSDIHAIGVDLLNSKPQYVVVADAQSVKVIDLFKNSVALLGTAGDIGRAGGIAIAGQQPVIAYVSDKDRHRIAGFYLQNKQYFAVAGTSLGYENGDAFNAKFNAPSGISFLEHNGNTNRFLLVADRNNHALRMVDTLEKQVSTWFQNTDPTSPDLLSPVDVAVATPAGVTSVYVVDAEKQALSVIQRYLYNGIATWISTQLYKEQGVHIDQNTRIVPAHRNPDALLYIDDDKSTTKVKALDTTGYAGIYTSGGQCHFPCLTSDCAAVSAEALCGNGMLNSGEECDDGLLVDGCDAACHIKPTYACPVGEQACVSPQQAYEYALDHVYYLPEDCLLLTAPPGFRVNNHCELVDINECNELTSTCGAGAKCFNTQGNYQCQCLKGYYGDGVACATTAYSVYTAFEIGSIPYSSFTSSAAESQAIILDIKAAYSRFLVSATGASNLPSVYNLTTREMAQMHTAVRMYPQLKYGTRFEVSTLFPNDQQAQLVTAVVGRAQAQLLASIQAAVSPTGMHKVITISKTQYALHQAESFSSAVQVTGWGMNITSVTYNGTCKVYDGKSPPGGCWVVDLIYMGGTDDSTDNTSLQSMNVLYLPSLEKRPNSTIPVDWTQSLTLTSTNMFPCKTESNSDGSIPRKATACCLRDVASQYRTNAKFDSYLRSAQYTGDATDAICAQSTFQQDQPSSGVIHKIQLPDGQTNDLVTGNITGMPWSEVLFLETVDYQKRIHRVRLILEENDLIRHAAKVEGNAGSEYNMSFFVGLANFQPARGMDVGQYTSILQTRSMQQLVTVVKSSVLTISTYGANQDTLVSFSDMQLQRVKVTDFFQPTKYLYYLTPTVVMPSGFTAPPDVSIVPLGSIRVLKSEGGATSTDPYWQQACSSAGGDDVFANQTLQTLVRDASRQPCVNENLNMCSPPLTVEWASLLSFGVPLPIGYITEADLSSSPRKTINLQFTIVAYQPFSSQLIQSSVRLSMELSSLSMTSRCDTRQASADIRDIVDGTVLIGTATTNSQWNNMLQKKRNFDMPGSRPSDSFLFQTTTVQGAVMTFAALGDPAYFLDPRASNYQVEINDIFSVHFLEPLNGKGGPTPKYDQALTLFQQGGAFTMKTDTLSGTNWMEPTAELISLCPYTPVAGKLSCVTRKDSTKAQRSSSTVLVTPDATGLQGVQGLFAKVMNGGGVTYDSNSQGQGFIAMLLDKLQISSSSLRYRKAYMINPVVDWSMEAIQSAQPGATTSTVYTRIMAIGLITVTSPTGTTGFRRLLSVQEQPTMGRALLQAADGGLGSPTKTSSPQAQVVSLDDVPGQDGTTLLCRLAAQASVAQCKVDLFQLTISLGQAQQLCTTERSSSLGTLIQSEIGNSVLPASVGLTSMMVVDYTITGCTAADGLSGGRRLLGEDVVQVVFKTVSKYKDNMGSIDIRLINQILGISNPGLVLNSLGGGAYVNYMQLTVTPGGNVTVNVTVKNVTNTSNKESHRKDFQDQMFTASASRSFYVSLINMLLALAVAVAACT